MTMKFGRREFLHLTGGAAAVTFGIRPAFASSGPVVLGTWGGDTEKALGSLARLAKEKHGVDVAFDVGTPSARKTKLLAQLNRPRNGMDIPFLTDADMFQMNRMNALKKLEKSAIPNYDDLLDDFKESDYSVPVMYSALVLVYNKKVDPPKSIVDLWKDTYKGKVGFADLSYDKIIPMAAVAHGGSTKNLGPAYDALLKLKQQGARVYSSNEAVGNAFQSEEIAAAIMWKGRAFQWMEAGLPLTYALPAEGAYPVFFELAVTRNSGVPKEAELVLGGSLVPEVQRTMALAIGQVPTTKNAGLSPDVEAKIAFTAEERKNFIRPDHAHGAEKSAEMVEFWNQKFKG
jgi:putative spermidine/putrescine transport system substrate-binding protein